MKRNKGGEQVRGQVVSEKRKRDCNSWELLDKVTANPLDWANFAQAVKKLYPGCKDANQYCQAKASLSHTTWHPHKDPENLSVKKQPTVPNSHYTSTSASVSTH